MRAYTNRRTPSATGQAPGGAKSTSVASGPRSPRGLKHMRGRWAGAGRRRLGGGNRVRAYPAAARLAFLEAIWTGSHVDENGGA